MITEEYREPAELAKSIHNREVYIWGARHDGYATSLVLKRLGITQKGFIDSSEALQGTTAFGYSIDLPNDFFQTHDAHVRRTETQDQ